MSSFSRPRLMISSYTSSAARYTCQDTPRRLPIIPHQAWSKQHCYLLDCEFMSSNMLRNFECRRTHLFLAASTRYPICISEGQTHAEIVDMEVQSQARLAAGQPQDTGERREVDEGSCCADGLEETLCIELNTPMRGHLSTVIPRKEHPGPFGSGA